MPFDMDEARVKTIKKLKKKLARYEQVEIEKMVEEKWDEATEKIASQLATALKENEKLKKQKTKKLPAGFVMIEQKSFDKVAKDLMKVSEEKKQLEKENKELKEKLEFQTESWEKGWETGKSDTWDEIDDAVKPLKEEITKLKQFKSEVIDAMKYDDDLDDEDIIRGIRGMEEEIIGECELKEEITKLKAEIDDAVENHFADLKLRETTHKEWDTLQEELLYYQFYTYTVGLLDDLTKEDVDNFTDSQVQRKTLYERIGYDEEPDRCVSCDKTFDLSYTMRHADKETKQKYDEYFGSEDDGGDLCTECLHK